MSAPQSAGAVLVVGEALMDIVDRAGEPREEHVGGSPANVALGLGRLGVPVRLRTALGADERGERIAAHLRTAGVEVDADSFVLDRTSTAIARIGESGDAAYDFDIDWRVPRDVDLGGAPVVHVGSIGCFIEPGASAVLAFLRRVAGRTRVTFDPNIRPALIADQAAAVRVVEEIAGLAEVVKLSDEDAAWLYPADGPDAVIDRLLAQGAAVAAITLGGDGALIGSRTARARVPARRVQVSDTVGAGDTFMAALVASLAEGRLDHDESSLVEAARRAVIAASITVSRPGADLPSAVELRAALSDG